MFLTAHSGANGTPANETGFFEEMKHVNADVIEVDIRNVKGRLMLTHNKVRFWQKKELLSLEYAFEFIKEYDFSINCDLKTPGLVHDLMALIEKCGVEDRIIITGSAGDAEDLKNIRFGDLYVNADYLPKLLPKNVKKMRDILDQMGPCAKGINISYKDVTDEFFLACEKENVPVSVFTVDDVSLIKKYAAYPAVVNITTRMASKGLAALGREVNK